MIWRLGSGCCHGYRCHYNLSLLSCTQRRGIQLAARSQSEYGCCDHRAYHCFHTSLAPTLPQTEIQPHIAPLEMDSCLDEVLVEDPR